MISIERAYQWKEEGRIHVSPHEAAEVLDADPYTLNICAHVGSFGIVYFFDRFCQTFGIVKHFIDRFANALQCDE